MIPVARASIVCASSMKSSQCSNPLTNLQCLQANFAAVMSVKAKTHPSGMEKAARPKKIKDYKHALYKIWHRCYMDKKEFAQQKICITQGDVKNLCEAQHLTPHAGLYAVPRHPSKPLSRENALWLTESKEGFFWRSGECPETRMSTLAVYRTSDHRKTVVRHKQMLMR